MQSGQDVIVERVEHGHQLPRIHGEAGFERVVARDEMLPGLGAALLVHAPAGIDALKSLKDWLRRVAREKDTLGARAWIDQPVLDDGCPGEDAEPTGNKNERSSVLPDVWHASPSEEADATPSGKLR